jgi:hypothetical protein
LIGADRDLVRVDEARLDVRCARQADEGRLRDAQVHQIPPPPAFPLPAFTAQIAGALATGGTVFGDTPPIPHAFPIATWTAARP